MTRSVFPLLLIVFTYNTIENTDSEKTGISLSDNVTMWRTYAIEVPFRNLKTNRISQNK